MMAGASVFTIKSIVWHSSVHCCTATGPSGIGCRDCDAHGLLVLCSKVTSAGAVWVCAGGHEKLGALLAPGKALPTWRL